VQDKHGRQQAYMKLQREPGIDGKGVVLKNVKYFDAVQNDGFQMYKSEMNFSCSMAGGRSR